jgi:hypothetical protein
MGDCFVMPILYDDIGLYVNNNPTLSDKIIRTPLGVGWNRWSGLGC